MPNEDKTFDDAQSSGQSDFSGDDFGTESSTPEDRGDFFEPDEDTSVEESEAESDAADAEDTSDESDESDDTDEGDDAESDDEGEGEEDSSDDDGDVDEPEEEDEPEEKVKGKVPRGRLNKEIEKRKALEAQIKALQAQAPRDVERDEPAPAPAKTLSKEQFIKMQNAMLDGDTDQSFEAFVEMLNEQAASVREATLAEVDAKVDSTVDSRTAQSELSREAAVQAKRFPELDSDSEYADEGLIDEVIEIRDVYAAQGISPAEALRKAVRLVSMENELEDRTVKREPAKVKEKPVDTAAKLELAKKEKGKLGGDSNKTQRPKVDVSKMSDSEYSRLSEEAKARARGDFI